VGSFQNSIYKLDLNNRSWLNHLTFNVVIIRKMPILSPRPNATRVYSRRTPPTPNKIPRGHSHTVQLMSGSWKKQTSLRERASYRLLNTMMTAGFGKDAPSVLNLPIINQDASVVLSEHAGSNIVKLTDSDITRLSIGLSYLHSAGVVHGDVSVRNICRGLDQEVYLIDFGSVAKIGQMVKQDESSYISQWDDDWVKMTVDLESVSSLRNLQVRLEEMHEFHCLVSDIYK
jgi:serine/threonine protein kinase